MLAATTEPHAAACTRVGVRMGDSRRPPRPQPGGGSGAKKKRSRKLPALRVQFWETVKYQSMEPKDAALLAATCVGQFLACHACGTVLFDVVHTVAHVLPRKAMLSRWHHYHHKFQGANLKILGQFEAENLTNHLVPEWLTSLVPAAVVAASATPLGWVQLTALTFLVVRSIVFVVAGLIMKGRDSNHVELDKVQVCKNWVLVGPHYHALHHVFPGQYMSSFVKLLDYILGTAAAPLAGR
eukprot:scaffold24078_cov114-Isochrysis_galbana.AAC.1